MQTPANDNPSRPMSPRSSAAELAAERIERLLDEALAQSFPASDPISVTVEPEE